MKRSSLSVIRRGTGFLSVLAAMGFTMLCAISVVPHGVGHDAGHHAGPISPVPVSGASSRNSLSQFDCLPEGWNLADIVSYKSNGKSADRNLTIEDKLKELKAHCRRGKLVDGKGREIRFFRFSCFGNPPQNYEEIVQQERKELEKLQKDYNVVVLECDPRIS